MARSAAAPLGFPASSRLRKRREYLAVQTGGRPHHARHFLAIVMRGQGAEGRIGFTVSKRVGNAVIRNRIKRWLREYTRQRREAFVPPGCDVVVIAKASAAKLHTFAEIEADLDRLRGRLSA